MMASPSLDRRLFWLLGLLCLVVPPFAQQPPADPAEISAALLYHPARQIEITSEGVTFRAAKFAYTANLAWDKWTTKKESNPLPPGPLPTLQAYTSTRLGTEFHFAGKSTDDEGLLEIRKGGEDGPVARIALWNRKQLAHAWLAFMRQDSPGLTVDVLAADLEVADPVVAGVADDGKMLWLAIRYPTGEGSLGVGTLVRYDLQTEATETLQPAALATSSITHIAAAAGTLWLGTARQGEGAIHATNGFVRFDPASGEVRELLLQTRQRPGRIVTALAAQENRLWLATDAGLCRMELTAETLSCAPIVPVVKLAAPAPVSARPGGPVRGRLAPDTYEVLWANANFLEVETPDTIEGWVAVDDLQENEKRNFDRDPYELGNGGSSAIAPVRLLNQPGGDPLVGALIYRARLERVGSPNAEGWQRVRAKIGWISRTGLEVMPVVSPAIEEFPTGRP